MINKSLFIIFALSFLISSCTKIQTTDIGSGLIPPIDGVNTKDTVLDIITNTYFDTSSTLVYKADDQVIGTISDDPLFGTTTASSFFELKPLVLPFYFPGTKSTRIPDSAVLVLSYKGVYGDSTKLQTWRVYEINHSDTLKYDSLYAANKANIGYTNLPSLGSKTFDIRRLADTVKNNYEISPNEIRIKLDPNVAKRFINDYDSTNAYATDLAFRKNFAGFAVVPDPGGNALLRINLLDTNTKLALYYSFKSDATAKDTAAVTYFRFLQNSGTESSGNANTVKRNYTGSQVATHAPNTSRNDSLVYVQTSPGTYVQLRIPGLSSFSNSLIHRAEIVADQVPDDASRDGLLAPPRYLLLTAYDSVNKVKRNIPNDYIVDASGVNNISTFGGFMSLRNVDGLNVPSYNFNLTRYVQGIVSRKDTAYTLRLSAPSNDSIHYKDPYPATIYNTYYIVPSSANILANGRVRLGGGFGDKNRRYRMGLRIIYSKL